MIAHHRHNNYPLARLGYTYTLSGQNAKAEKILDGLLLKDGKPGYPSFASAPICAVLGRKEEALRWWRKAYEERSPDMVRLNSDSALVQISFMDPRLNISGILGRATLCSTVLAS